MAYKFPYIKLSWNWVIPGTDEIGTSGVSLINSILDAPPAGWFGYQASQIDEYANVVADFWSSDLNLVPRNLTLTSVKMALIGTDGKYLTEAVEYPITAVGFPIRGYAPQIAIVSTLSSEKFKDPGKYSRFYTPSIVNNDNNTYCLDPGAQANYLTALTEFIEGINAVGSGTGENETAKVGVVSPKGSGSSLYVTEVKVGRLYDTQRRRRNRLSENYVEGPINISPTP